MIPVYLMPEMMQTVSIVSPLGWGMEAMQILVLRGGRLAETWPYLMRLLICFVVCCLLPGADCVSVAEYFWEDRDES